MNSKSETKKATRYVDIFTDVLNVSITIPLESVSLCMIGIFDTALIDGFRPSFTLNLAFLSGSSRHGKDFRAPSDSNWVTASHEIFPSGLVYWLKKGGGTFE